MKNNYELLWHSLKSLLIVKKSYMEEILSSGAMESLEMQMHKQYLGAIDETLLGMKNMEDQDERKERTDSFNIR